MNPPSDHPFYSDIAFYYEKIFPLKPEPLNFVLSELKDTKDPRHVLDVGCSTGQMAYALSDNGFHVTGLDLDPAMITIANLKSHNVKNRPEFRIGSMTDLRTIAGGNFFDGIICLGNTVPHLTNLSERRTFFSESYNILKENGRMLIQTVNYDHILAKKQNSLPVIDNDEIRFERNYVYSENDTLISFKTSLTIKSSGEQINGSVLLYPLVKNEIQDLLWEAGFTSAEFFGNYKKDPYLSDSPAIIVSASR